MHLCINIAKLQIGSAICAANFNTKINVLVITTVTLLNCFAFRMIA